MENRFPEELSRLPQWVCWRLEQDKAGRAAKVPYSPKTGYKASSNNPNTWGKLDEALLSVDKYMFSGVGFVFTTESGIVGIDIDHCIEDGQLNPVASDILAHIPPTYIEVSPSGKGLHIFLRGTLPSGGNKNSKTGVEMYSSNRYFTMTGKCFQGSVDSITADSSGILEYIHQKYIVSDRKSRNNQSFQAVSTLSDDEVLRLAQGSKDGAKFTSLWRGEWQNDFASQSEADFALCRKLAFWCGRDETQIDRLFRQSALFRDKWDTRHSANGLTYGQQTVQNACKATENVYAPAKKKDADVFQQGNAYYRRKGEKYYQITNFVVSPIEMIIAQDEAQLSCELITERGEKFPQAFTSGDFSTVQKFKSVLNKRTIALSFYGGEGDLELFKTYIYENLEWKKKRGVKALGIYRHKQGLVFVDSAGAVGVGGKQINDIVQMEKYRSMESRILQADFLDKSGLQMLSEHILRYNEPAKTVPILAWTAACFIKPHLRNSDIKFPHLFLIGEAGSGKSNTLERVILPIFSRSKVSASSPVSGFTLMMESASSNIIPQALDEFKPSKLDKLHLNWLFNHFRDSYDCHEGVRGRADQTQITYDLLAPIAVAGEESADESAIRERSVELLFSKKDIRQQGCRESFAWLSGKGNLLNSFGRSILDIALSTTPKEVKQWFKEGKDSFSGDLPLRVLDNLCCLYAGLCLLGKLCGRLGCPRDTLFQYDHEACTRYIQFAAQEYLLDGGTNNKAIVEQTFEIMARMKLKQGEDYAFENNGQFLCFCLSSVYDRYTKYRKDYAIVGEVLPANQFKKQLEHSEFFIEKNRSKRMGEEVRKVWTVDFAVLSKRCDVSGFVKEIPSVPPSM
jgi:hypothetical protein